MTLSADVVADFAARFTEFWRAPDPQNLPKLLTDDVHLEAPMTPSTNGIDAAIQIFESLLALYPDLHADVHRWGPHDSGLFIEFTLRATSGGKDLAIRAVDDVLLRDDGLATERISYFDPSPLASG